jgi:subtilisin family serine protease
VEIQVKYVEPDMVVNATKNVVQPNVPSWGLARISSKEPGATDYVYDSTAGQGIVVYGVDTGIDIEHPDFEGRAEWGTNTADNDNTDANGHGTHTASTAVGKKFGVAKKASVVAIKVLGSDGSGTNSQVISGMEWAVKDAESRGITGKSVMNMSLGGAFSQAMNDAATSVVKAGVFLSAAAGNAAKDASNSSPASAPIVCTIAASTLSDGSASFTNFGSVGECSPSPLVRSVLVSRESVLMILLQSTSMLLARTSLPHSLVVAQSPYLEPLWLLPMLLVPPPT